MPGLPKDRPSGRLGRLISALRPARAGPLPVQTGFPTSLADLFVKNHGRLRKPSSCASAANTRRKKRGAPPLPTSPPSPTPSPPAPAPPSPPPPQAAAVSPPAQPIIPDLPTAEPVCHAVAAGGGDPFGLGLGFLALVGVVSLALLVIWSRKVVAAVTVAAFSLFLLETVRSLSLRGRPRPVAAKEALDLVGGRGYVSPIREAEAADPEPPRRSISDSGVLSVVSTEDMAEERSEAGGDDSGSPGAKSKRRSWRKLIPRKLQRGGRTRSKEADPPSRSASFRSESSEADASVGGNAIARARDASDSRRGSGRIPADAVALPSSDRSGSRHGSGRIPADAVALPSWDRSGSRHGSGRIPADAVALSSWDRSGPRHGSGRIPADAVAMSSDRSGPRAGTDAEARGHGGRLIEVDASADLGGVEGVAGSRSRLSCAGAIVVVLVGLAAGRVPAVAFTVLCCALVGSLQRLPVGMGWRGLEGRW
uniref:Uncharacterized protein n=1 Tax=Avena sativa TaxID=4498 RepID=A0ACD5WD33_AVESA